MKRAARVIVASQRAAEGVYEDTTGPLIVRWLEEKGFQTSAPVVVPDGEPVGQALRACLTEDVHFVLTTGGTGISSTDRTPEFTAEVLDYQLPGVSDAIRRAGLPQVPTAVLSRGIAGVVTGANRRVLVVNLPGSRGGVQDGLKMLGEIIDHAMDQLRDGDHVRADVPKQFPGKENFVHSARIAHAEVTEKELSVEEHAKLVEDSAAGAVVTFTGVVRDHDGGKAVSSLFYEGHPTASEVLSAVVAEKIQHNSGVRAVAVSHRIGALEIGDIALVCAVSADHRGKAFSICSDLVDEIKLRLPIWKNQHFADGTQEWVNSP